MPYYKETFLNRSLPSSWTNAGVLQNSGFVALDSVEMTGFRARPHKSAVSSVEVSALSADPYAYFLESTSRKKYHDRLSERGLQPEGEPDKGHPFELKRHTVAGSLHTIRQVQSGINRLFEGAAILPATANMNLFTGVHAGNIFGTAPYKETGLDAFAQQAYSRVAPTSVVFDAGLFLGELREGLPKLSIGAIKSAVGFLKGTGSGYLNVEFGWKPFISDLQNMGRALSGASDVLARQGRRVHRKYSLPPLTDFDSTTFTGNLTLAVQATGGFADRSSVGGNWSTTTSPLTGTTVYSKSRSSRRWFEGEFTNFLPIGFDASDYQQRLSQLLDPRITPSDLWELAPWSWLVDWNLRIGDTIHSNELAANDRLIMHYGYAMEHTVYTTEAHWKANVAAPAGWSNLPLKGGWFATTQYKRRLRANPYGFRVGGAGSLTGGQYAILGALGLTKLK